MRWRSTEEASLSQFAEQPVEPFAISLDREGLALWPEGPVLTRRMSALEHLFADTVAWRIAVDAGDPIVYTVRSSPVPELRAELPQSVTTILPGAIAGEFYMTKGHQHQNLEGEMYLGIEGTGGLLMFNGSNVRWLDMKPDTIGYIPPGWAHRSVNTGAEPYSFLAVYPGDAGHDYEWVREHGFGSRVFRGDKAPQLLPY